MDRYEEALNLDDYFKGRDKTLSGSERRTLYDNAERLLEAVVGLLREVQWGGPIVINSGYRSPEINEKVKGSAKRSYHMSGQAIDLNDHEYELYDLILHNADLLMSYGLWMESCVSTPTWVHLDMGTRRERAVRVFRA